MDEDVRRAQEVLENAASDQLLSGMSKVLRDVGYSKGFAAFIGKNDAIAEAMIRGFIKTNEHVNPEKIRALNKRLKIAHQQISGLVESGAAGIKRGLSDKQHKFLQVLPALVQDMATLYPQVLANIPNHPSGTHNHQKTISDELRADIQQMATYSAELCRQQGAGSGGVKMAIVGDNLTRSAKEPKPLAWNAAVRKWVAGTALLGSLGLGSNEAYKYVEKNITDPARAVETQLGSKIKETSSSEGVLLKRRNLTRTQKDNNDLRATITNAETKISTIADRAEDIEGVFDVLATLLAMSAFVGAGAAAKKAMNDGDEREESWKEKIVDKANELQGKPKVR